MKYCYILLVLSLGVFSGCEPERSVSASGAQAVSVTVPVDSNGQTAEQKNVSGRIELEKPGAVKHVYIISATTGDCILYSTAKGKVTSGGKKLMPGDARPQNENLGGLMYLPNGWITNQRPNEDGTYGDSSEMAQAYLYWFDVRGNYHQHYLLGGQIIHVSDVPMSWPKIILNLETVGN